MRTAMARNLCFLIIGLIVLVSVCLASCAPVYRYSMAYCAQEAARAAARELSPFERAEWLAQRGCNVVQAIDANQEEAIMFDHLPKATFLSDYTELGISKGDIGRLIRESEDTTTATVRIYGKTVDVVRTTVEVEGVDDVPAEPQE